MNVMIEIEINGRTKTFNVPVEIAQYIGDLRQQNTMLRKAQDRIAAESANRKPKDK